MNYGYGLRVWYSSPGYEQYLDCKNYVTLRLGRVKLQWFLDCGDWFVYVYLGRRYWRWSSAGYLTGILTLEETI